MQSFGIERKLFLIAALVLVLACEAGLVVGFQLNLPDPVFGGSVRGHWVTAGTPLTAPPVFIVPYSLFLVLAFRQRWVGTVGIVGVTALALLSGLFWIPDRGMVQRVLAQHLAVWIGLPLALLALSTPAIMLLGVLTLLRQRGAQGRAAILPDPQLVAQEPGD